MTTFQQLLWTSPDAINFFSDELSSDGSIERVKLIGQLIEELIQQKQKLVHSGSTI
jgi:hypothetical protein